MSPLQQRKALESSLGKGISSQGLNTNSTLPTKNSDTTVLDAYSEFAKNYLIARQYSQKTIDGYWWIVKSFIQAVGNIDTLDITESSIGEWVSYMDRKGMQKSTMHTNVSLFRVFVDYLYIRGSCKLHKDVIKAPKRPKNHPRYKKIDEVSKMIDACGSIRNKAIVSMLFVTGLRNSELRNLKRDQVDGSEVHVRGGKGLKDRLVLLNRETRVLLERYLDSRVDNSPYLFITSRGKLGNSTLRYIVNDAGRRAGVGATNPHALRHGCGTHMMKQNIHPRIVQEYLGHDNINTTQLYMHVEGGDIKSGHAKAFELPYHENNS